MINLFYQILVYLSRKWGIWVLYTAVWVVAAGFFLFFPKRVAISTRFYRAAFPHRPAWYPLWCAWQQFHNFTAIYIDRYFLEHIGDILYTTQGFHHIEKAVKNRTGGILLMSHLGNWEVAAHLLKQKGIPLMLFMGKKDGEQIEGMQKSSLQKNGVEVMASQSGQGSPMDILEGIRFLRKGWILSIAGDRLGNTGRSCVKTGFFRHSVTLPETPYALSLATGVPIYIFFALRMGRGKYHFIIDHPIYLHGDSRQSRRECVRETAQHYAKSLEQAVCSYPFEWHHFEPFLGPEQAPETPSSCGA